MLLYASKLTGRVKLKILLQVGMAKVPLMLVSADIEQER